MYGMDPSSISLLGFGAVVIVGAVAMYLVTLFSMKETSFEDVLKEQKKKKEEEDKERSLQNKRKREQYRKNFQEKKKKPAVGNGKVEKVDSGVSPMHEVQIKETPQMESGEPATPVPEPKKQPKGKAAKKQQDSPTPKEGSPKPSHPILKAAPEKQKETPANQSPKAEAQQKKQDGGRTRTVSFSDEQQEKAKADQDQEKSKKKKKKEPEVESEVVGQVREATLSDRDVQNILTLIKQKYAIDVGGGSKIKELQSQLDLTKKQLAQSETNLQQYVNRCMGAENKIEQLKQDLMVEKTKITSLEKALQDSETKRKQEVSLIQTRHDSEMKQIQEKIAMAADYEEKCKALEQLKSEKNYLVAEIQKNANVVGENSRITNDLQQVRTQLQDSQRRCAELESQLQHYTVQSESMQQAQGEKEKHLLLQLNEQANAFQQMQQNYSSLDSEFQKVKSELQATQSNSTKLLEQVTSLTEDNDAKTESHRALEERLADSKRAVADREAKIQDMTKQNKALSGQVQNLEQQIAQLNSQIVKIDQETKSKAAADVKSGEDLEQIKKLQDELENVKKDKDRFKEEAERLKKKNNDLRERSWKAMDTLSNMEKSIPEKVAAARAEGDVRCARLESSVKQSLSNAFPDVSVGENDFETWVKLFTSQASECSQTVQSTEASPELEEAREEVQKLRSKLEKSSGEMSELRLKVSNLETSVKNITEENSRFEESSKKKQDELSLAVAECEKYKTVLSRTEDVLCKLQSSVEVEEGVWKKKVEEAHREASKAHQDAEDLRKTIDELKSEKSLLHADLKESEELKKRLEEMTSEVSDLKEQLETAKAAVTNSLQQTEDERLEKEKTLTKNLGQAATKLQNVLKQTQDQLNEEREKNAELEKMRANDVQENSEPTITQQTIDAADGTCV